MRNVTLSIDEATLRAARRIAAERGTSPNAMIRGHLEELTRREAGVEEARRRIVELSRRSKAGVGTRTWTREDLHGR